MFAEAGLEKEELLFHLLSVKKHKAKIDKALLNSYHRLTDLDYHGNCLEFDVRNS